MLFLHGNVPATDPLANALIKRAREIILKREQDRNNDNVGERSFKHIKSTRKKGTNAI